MKLIVSTILKSKKIALFSHVNPDGDSLGCMCALFLTLKKLNIQSTMFCDGTVPTNFTHLSCANEITSGEISKDYDLYVAADASSIDRIGKYENAFKKAPNSIQIDHHSTNTMFAKQNLVDAKSSSCCEIIYKIILQMGVEINSDIAACLMGGIYSDTGAFCNGNTTSNSFLVASKLASLCPNLRYLTYNLFRKRTMKEFMLWQKVLENTTFELGNKVCVWVVNNTTLVEMGASEKDTNFIISSSGMVEGVLINVFICEHEKNIYKVGFRSIDCINVSSIATNLGGGGHKNASGCSLMGQYHSIYSQVMAECEKEISRCKRAE